MPTRATNLTRAADMPAGLARDAMCRITHHLREWDRREIFATRWADDPDDLAMAALQMPEISWIAWRDGEPVAAIGTIPMHPTLWSPWCFGTDRFGQVGLLLTRLARRAIIPVMAAAGPRVRAEVKSLDGHEDAQRWLERSFGAHREATHPGYGKGGETFHTYVLMLEAGHVLQG